MRFKHIVKIYNHNLLKISTNNHPLVHIHINNHSLLYIHINTHNNYHKKYTQKDPKYFINFFFLVYTKIDQENIMFYKNKNKSYTMTDLYLNHISFRYEDSYNYYDIDFDKILLFVKSDNEYIIRYNDVNTKKIVPIQK